MKNIFKIAFVSLFVLLPVAKINNVSVIQRKNIVHNNIIDNEDSLTIQDKKDRYNLKKSVLTPIRTYEAWVDTYETGVNQGSTIIGNYSEDWTPGITFRLYTYDKYVGCPQLNIRYSHFTQKSYMIEENICGTGKRHIAFTISDNKISGFLDGKLKKTWTFDGDIPIVDLPYSVGGDNRQDNTWWFRGSIYSIYCFSTVRNKEQIKQDYENGINSNDDLLIGFDFKNHGFNNIADPTNPLVTYLYDDEFIDSSNYDYTFAVVPDTQAVMYYYPNEFYKIYDTIVDKKDDMKIELAIGLGDITERNIDEEWLLARENIYKLYNNNIPFTLIRGNHDVIGNKVGENLRLKKFSQYFDNNQYRSQLSGFYQNRIDNAYRLFEINDIKYLIMLIDYGADDDVLEWANRVVEAHHEHNVIVVTHAFLYRDGEFLTGGKICPPADLNGYNNGDDIWDKFVKKHANISMVLCGHDPETQIVKSTFVGDHGNKVTCLLIDHQYYDSKCEGIGDIAFFHFSNEGKDITVESYASLKGKFFRHCNQISFSVETVESKETQLKEYTHSKYEKINSIDDINPNNDIIISNLNSTYSMSFEDKNVISSPIQNVNAYQDLVFDDNTDAYKISKESNGYTIKNKNNMYLSISNEKLSVDTTPTYFELEVKDYRVIIKHNGKYVYFARNTNNFAIGKKSDYSFVNMYILRSLNTVDQEVKKYIDHFVENYHYFDNEDNIANYKYVYEVAKQDYKYLSSNARALLYNKFADNKDEDIGEFRACYRNLLKKDIWNNIDFMNIASIDNNRELTYIVIISMLGIITLASIGTLIAFVIKKNKQKNNQTIN